ncbi:hypothetical protein BH09VER1_BH09VER1_41710 [soil metagenome]
MKCSAIRAFPLLLFTAISILEATPEEDVKQRGNLSTIVAQAFYLVQCGAEEPELKNVRAKLAENPPPAVLEAMMANLKQSKTTIDRRRIRGAIDRLLSTQEGNYLEAIKIRLKGESIPENLALFINILAKIGDPDLRNTLRPLLEDSRASMELLGMEAAEGAVAPRVDDCAYNIIEASKEKSARDACIVESDSFAKRDAKILQLKKELDATPQP